MPSLHLHFAVILVGAALVCVIEGQNPPPNGNFAILLPKPGISMVNVCRCVPDPCPQPKRLVFNVVDVTNENDLLTVTSPDFGKTAVGAVNSRWHFKAATKPGKIQIRIFSGYPNKCIQKAVIIITDSMQPGRRLTKLLCSNTGGNSLEVVHQDLYVQYIRCAGSLGNGMVIYYRWVSGDNPSSFAAYLSGPLPYNETRGRDPNWWIYMFASLIFVFLAFVGGNHWCQVKSRMRESRRKLRIARRSEATLRSQQTLTVGVMGEPMSDSMSLLSEGLSNKGSKTSMVPSVTNLPVATVDASVTSLRRMASEVGLVLPHGSAAQPTTAQPTTAQPATAQPATAQPATAQPTTAQPTTAQPTTDQSTTDQPTTAQPTTAQPSAATLQASTTTVQKSATTVQTSATTVQPSSMTLQPSATTVQSSATTAQKSAATLRFSASTTGASSSSEDEEGQGAKGVGAKGGVGGGVAKVAVGGAAKVAAGGGAAKGGGAKGGGAKGGVAKGGGAKGGAAKGGGAKGGGAKRRGSKGRGSDGGGAKGGGTEGGGVKEGGAKVGTEGGGVEEGGAKVGTEGGGVEEGGAKVGTEGGVEGEGAKEVRSEGGVEGEGAKGARSEGGVEGEGAKGVRSEGGVEGEGAKGARSEGGVEGEGAKGVRSEGGGAKGVRSEGAGVEGEATPMTTANQPAMPSSLWKSLPNLSKQAKAKGAVSSISAPADVHVDEGEKDELSP